MNAMIMLKIHYSRFTVDGKLPTCCGLVSDTAHYLDMSRGRQSAQPTSSQQVVVMEFGKRPNTTDTTDFCPRQLVTDLLRTCYGDTGVMDFGLRPMRIYQEKMSEHISSYDEV